MLIKIEKCLKYLRKNTTTKRQTGTNNKHQRCTSTQDALISEEEMNETKRKHDTELHVIQEDYEKKVEELLQEIENLRSSAPPPTAAGAPGEV